MKKNFIGKKIVLRADLNIPLSLTNLTRIEAIKPTLDVLSYSKFIFILSHLGRPKGYDASLSLRPLVSLCEKVWGKKVGWFDDGVTDDIQIYLLENLRFNPKEEQNDHTFAKTLALLGDIYVNEAFSCSHRSHASIDAITNYLPSFAGVNCFKEVKILKKFQRYDRPAVGILGGSKISTKIGLLETLLKKLDLVILGGAMAHPFLVAQGKNIGQSFCESQSIPLAKELLDKEPTRFLLPVDVITEEGEIDLGNLQPDQTIYDLGSKSLNNIKNVLLPANTVIWNGPIGYFEKFLKSSITLTKILSQCTKKGATVIAGGGDTVAAIHSAEKILGYKADFSHVSTAGGAFIEFIEGKTLSGIAALKRHI